MIEEIDIHGEATPIRQYHLKLDDPDLLAFVRHVTNRVWKGLAPRLPVDARSAGAYVAMRKVIEEELREHVVGMDLCGLAGVCSESEEYDPWPEADDLPSGLVATGTE